MLVAILFHPREQFDGDTTFQLLSNPPAYYLGDTIKRVREVAMIDMYRQEFNQDPDSIEDVYDHLMDTMCFGESEEEIDDYFNETSAWIIHKEDYDKIVGVEADIGNDSALYRHISTLKQIVHNFSIGILHHQNP